MLLIPPFLCSIHDNCTNFEFNHYYTKPGSSCKNSLSYLVASRPQYLLIYFINISIVVILLIYLYLNLWPNK